MQFFYSIYLCFIFFLTLFSIKPVIGFLFFIFNQADHMNLFELLAIFLVLIWMIIFLFLLCEFGERMTNRFEMFDDELCRCDWYLLPIEIRRMYMIFKSDTQHPVNICSFFNITCEREIFKLVITHIMQSYYILKN